MESVFFGGFRLEGEHTIEQSRRDAMRESESRVACRQVDGSCLKLLGLTARERGREAEKQMETHIGVRNIGVRNIEVNSL
jgi:hypothetical protein